MIKKYQKVISLTLILLSSMKISAAQNDDEAYCIAAGGLVVNMPAVFSTAKGDVRGFEKSFCNFYPENASITIGLETFSSDKPNIAATYLKKLNEIPPESPLWKGKAQNPSYNVCKNLGGTTISFVTFGGFTTLEGDVDVCVFGDGSMVSSWSLIYTANHREGYDIIRERIRSEPLDISVSAHS